MRYPGVAIPHRASLKGEADEPVVRWTTARAEIRFVGVPPHAFTSAPSRAIDNAFPIPIGRLASVGPMSARRSAAPRAASAGNPYGGTPKSGFRPFRLTRVATSL